MSFIHSLISAIATPARQLYQWFIQIVPGFRAIGRSSLPFRMALTTLIFLLIIWIAAGIKIFLTEKDKLGEINLFVWIGGGILGVIVIPTIVYYLTKYLMVQDESRFPEIDRIWYEALEECDRVGINLMKVPLFIGLGSPNVRFGGHLLKIAELEVSVSVPKQGEGDICVHASPDAVFVFVSGCSCLSKLAAMPRETMTISAPAQAPFAISDASRTIDPSFFATAVQQPQTVDFGRPPSGTFADASPGATLLLPEDHDFNDMLRNDEANTIVKAKQLSSRDVAACEERLRHVCRLIKDARGALCPINGLLSTVPFETIQSSSAQLQVAAQKDLAVLREELMVRCGNTVLITDMESEEGFQELINRFGPQRSRDFRFGKGSELWSPPDADRLSAISAHASGAFEDWIYILFQDVEALKRRYNSRLFMLLCKIRGQFSRSLADFIARGYGFDPATEPHLAYEQFLFGGCYFAATGNDPSRQAFVRSVLMKLIEQDGQLEWAPAARRHEQQYQFASNVAVLIGLASVIAIAAMLITHYTAGG